MAWDDVKTTNDRWTANEYNAMVTYIKSIEGGGSETECKSFFAAYDAGGGQAPGTNWGVLTFDTIGENYGGDVSYTADGEDFEFTSSGSYLIRYDMSAQVSDTSRSHCHWKFQVNTGSGYVDVPGTWSGTYHRTSDDDEATGSATAVINVNAYNTIRVVGDSDRATQVTTVPNGCRVYIEKLSV